jgi:hypothetical protein
MKTFAALIITIRPLRCCSKTNHPGENHAESTDD